MSEIYFFHNEVRIYLYIYMYLQIYDSTITKHDNDTVFVKEIAWSGKREAAFRWMGTASLLPDLGISFEHTIIIVTVVTTSCFV